MRRLEGALLVALSTNILSMLMLLGSGYHYIYILRLVVRVLQYLTGIDDGSVGFWILVVSIRSSLFALSFFFVASSLSVVLAHTLNAHVRSNNQYVIELKF